ncbi:BofC C-terminal domain-containing protein [Niallia sp. Krafla_26]|uniref:BofC C-terminal domain-containing protein n=1 Tax=Niallia sp. Krafla_26 TaxID=3064703 RepID=UPI003D16FDFA
MQTEGFIHTIIRTIIIWILILVGFQFGIQHHAFAETGTIEEEKTPITVDVLLKCLYMDGEISEETVTETIYSMENFWAKYEDWQFIGMENNKMVFHKKADDISPLLKANGYFGVTDDGILTIFNGRPYKSHIIQSFFQIDVGKLESRKREELKNGIRIKTKDRYVEVLETFKTYSKEKQAN